MDGPADVVEGTAGTGPDDEAAGSFRWSGLSGGDEGWFPPDGPVLGRGAYAGLRFHEVRARTVLNKVPAGARVPFPWTVNVYRGCSHACTYCFARPTHDHLGLDTGEGFDHDIVVKVNAVDVLRRELAPRRWDRQHVSMGTNTDPYQPAEGRYRLTRGVLGALIEARTPFSVLTKSTLVLRDLDLLVAGSAQGRVWVDLSIGSLDEAVWRATEPGTPAPWLRVRAVARLREAGIDCGVLVAPLQPALPGALDDVARLLDALAEARVTTVSAVSLRLGGVVRDHYQRTLARHPELQVGRGHRTVDGGDPVAHVRRLAAERGLAWGNRWAEWQDTARASAPSPAPEVVQLGLPGF